MLRSLVTLAIEFHDSILVDPLSFSDRWWRLVHETTPSASLAELGLTLPETAPLIEPSITIMTVHGSKGLEFDRVILPTAFYAKESDPEEKPHKNPREFPKKSDVPRFVNSAANRLITVDLGSPDFFENRALAARAEFAEEIRLLYVALTRAKTQTIVIVDPQKKNWQKTALGELIQKAAPGSDDITEALHQLAKSSDGTIVVSDQKPPRELTKDPLRFRIDPFDALKNRRISTQSITSFSSLYAEETPADPSHDLNEVNSPDYGTQTTSEIPLKDLVKTAKNPALLGHLAPGVTTGLFLHHVLEASIGNSDENAIRNAIEISLTMYPIENSNHTDIERDIRVIVDRVLRAGDASFSLSSIANRCMEMPFSVTAPNGGQAFGRTFFRGYMDLVFEHDGRYYVADFKSNFLGVEVDDYKHEAIVEAVRTHHYDAQLGIYSYALHRHLQNTVRNYNYEQHFGGAFALFLRGINEPEHQGVYFLRRHSPNELEAYFRPTAADVAHGLSGV
ncbi:MAG: 3'-5' exonuclease [Polyangiales bacterium]